jgi:hypothetical protein
LKYQKIDFNKITKLQPQWGKWSGTLSGANDSMISYNILYENEVYYTIGNCPVEYEICYNYVDTSKFRTGWWRNDVTHPATITWISIGL